MYELVIGSLTVKTLIYAILKRIFISWNSNSFTLLTLVYAHIFYLTLTDDEAFSIQITAWDDREGDDTLCHSAHLISHEDSFRLDGVEEAIQVMTDIIFVAISLHMDFMLSPLWPVTFEADNDFVKR